MGLEQQWIDWQDWDAVDDNIYSFSQVTTKVDLPGVVAGTRFEEATLDLSVEPFLELQSSEPRVLRFKLCIELLPIDVPEPSNPYVNSPDDWEGGIADNH